MISGVYHLYKDNKIVYVGKTKNIHVRIYQHKGKYDRYEFFPMDVEASKKIEKADIEKYNPILNFKPIESDLSTISVRVPLTILAKAEKKAKKMNLIKLNGNASMSDYIRHLIMRDVFMEDMK